jgi:phenylalanyl-tRNA synthetase beta chain
MAIVTFTKKQFEKDFGKLNDSMQNKIAMFGTPIEKLEENEVQIEIFPNRPDLLSYQGFKRGFSAFMGKKTGLKKYILNSPEKNYKVFIESSVKDVRPFTACAIVKELRLNDDKIKDLIEIQEKLHLTLGRKRKKLAIGIYPLEKIKLPITYKALEPDKIKFLPLESPRIMSGLEILQKHPTGKEYAHLLSGKTKFPIFIDANKEILSMPPIINSQLTGKVTEKTKDVFVECSGSDFNILKKCLNIIVTCLADMGGNIYQMKLKSGIKETTPNLNSEKMKISLENTNKLLGLTLTEKELGKHLREMGHNYEKGIVEIPAWRTDIIHEVDLIEEVAIAYGYENFIPEIPEISSIGKEDEKETIKRKISNILTGLNILEVSNYHLTNTLNQFSKQGIPKKQEKNYIEVEKSKTEYNILRKDLSHYLLKNISENVDAEYPQKIFEIGTVFNQGEHSNKIEETTNLAIALTPGNYTEIKQTIEYLFKMANLDLNFEEPKKIPSILIEGRSANILLKNKKIGYIGEVHPKILSNWKIKMPIAILEINLKEIFKELA